MSMVQTIRGSIPSAELGRTLSHEHLTNGTPGMERIPGLLDRAEMVDRCLEALGQAHDAGIDSIIDLTPFDLGRQVWLFEAVAERSPLNVVCATGVYRWVPVVYYGWDEDEIAAHFVREIREGIEGSQIRAGGDQARVGHRVPARAGGRTGLPARHAGANGPRGGPAASKATGVPISCHTRAVDELGTPLLDIFEDEGLDLRAVTIGHSNDTQDLDYLRGLAARGATVGLDRFSSKEDDYVAERSGIALALAKAGYAEQVCLGHDGSPAGLWAGWSEARRSDCWTLVPRHEVPWLLDNGATEDDVDAMLRRSIAATFEAAAAQ